jgi:hypothetical protein
MTEDDLLLFDLDLRIVESVHDNDIYGMTELHPTSTAI